jgi:hypothetical protein
MRAFARDRCRSRCFGARAAPSGPGPGARRISCRWDNARRPYEARSNATAKVVDLGAIAGTHDAISVSSDGLRLGAMVKMSAAADHPEILKNYPVVAQSLQQAASGQLRNMATLDGNEIHEARIALFSAIVSVRSFVTSVGWV